MRLIRQFFKLIWYFSLVVQILLAVAFFRFYRQWDPPPIQVPRKLDRAIRETVEQVPGQLPKPEIAQRPILVLPLANDREELLTTALRKALDDDGNYRTVDQSTLNQLLTKLGIKEENVTVPAEAIKLAKAAEAEVVIIGRVLTMKKDDKQTRVDFTAQAYQVSDAAPLFETTQFTNAPPEPVAKSSDSAQPTLGIRVLLGLACFLLLWPVLMVPLTGKVLDQESNLLTALLLMGMVTVPVVASWFVMLAGGAGLIRILLYILVIVIAGIWSIFVMNEVALSRRN